VKFDSDLKLEESHLLRLEIIKVSKRSLIDAYPDREFIYLQYLPRAIGDVLSVGVGPYNLDDHLSLPNPEKYFTIDLNSENEKYGSPYKHETIDFLNFGSNEKFDHILLFGVLGIQTNSEYSGDSYSLWGNEDKTLEKVNTLLHVGGTLLLGPELIPLGRKTKLKRLIAIKRWEKYFSQNYILANNYKLIFALKTKNNLTHVYTRAN